MFSLLKNKQTQKKVMDQFDNVFGQLQCDTLYVPVYAHERSQHALAAILDANINHFLAKALRSKRFTGHLTEYMWYIPQDLKGVKSICFFGVGPKERLNPTIFQSILNQVLQLDNFRIQSNPDTEKGSRYVIALNIAGQRNRLLKIK